MLKNHLIHPEISAILARAGHHAKVLIADGNYPCSSKKGPNATVISMNIMPGCITVAQALEAVLSAVAVDFINTMGIPEDDSYAQAGEPPVWNTFRDVVKRSGSTVTIEPILKWDFYKHVESPDHVLTIQTGDQALWANVLLTLGCRT